MLDTSARLLALLGLLQARRTGPALSWPSASRSAAARSATTSSRLRELGYPVEAVRGPGGLLPARRRRQAAAAAARRRGGGGGRGRAARGGRDQRHRGDQRPGAGQAGTRAAAPAAAPGHRDPRRDDQRAGEHRGQHRRPGDRPGAAEPRSPRAIRDRERAALRLPGRRRWSSRTGWSAGSGAGTWSAGTRATAAGRRTGWTGWRCAIPGGRRFTPAAAARRGLHRVRAARGRVRRLERARADHRRRPGRRGAGPDQPDGRGGREVDETTCVLVTGGDTIEIVAVYIGMLGLDFHVSDPPELVEHVAMLSARYARAVAVPPDGAPGRRPRTSGSGRDRSPRSRTAR